MVGFFLGKFDIFVSVWYTFQMQNDTNIPQADWYNPLFAYEIMMKRGAIEAIRIAKGWKSDAEMARNLCVTRQYITNLKNRRAHVTDTVIIRLAIALGNINNNWWIFFEIVPSHRIKNNNHPIYNLQKNNGQIPYEKWSVARINKSQNGEAVEVAENAA